MTEKTAPATGLALAIRDEHIAELEAEVADLETQLAAARQEAQELRTAACTRCAGSAIDPEDSSPGIHHDRGEEPPTPEPCRDCVHPDGAEPVAARWNKIVTRDEDGTVWVLCTTDPGQPVALRLDEDLAEALTGSLLGAEDGEEVEMAEDHAAIRDRVAEALYVEPDTPSPTLENVRRMEAAHRAYAVMTVVGPELAARDQIIRELEEQLAATFSPARRAAAQAAVLDLLAHHHPDAHTTGHGGTGHPRALADDAAAYAEAAINALVGGA